MTKQKINLPARIGKPLGKASTLRAGAPRPQSRLGWKTIPVTIIDLDDIVPPRA